MKKYYHPSKDEYRIMEKTKETIALIAKEKLKLKNVNIILKYEDNSCYERMSNNKPILIHLYSLHKTLKMKVLVQNGIIIYYQVENCKKEYVATLKEIKKYSIMNIEKGEWISYEVMDNIKGNSVAEDIPDLFEEFAKNTNTLKNKREEYLKQQQNTAGFYEDDILIGLMYSNLLK